MILGIHVKNFEALYDMKLGLSRESLLKVDSQADQNQGDSRVLSELTGIIGENNVGKSSIFRAMSFFRTGLMRGFHIAATEANNIGFSQLISRGAEGNMTFDLICYAADLQKVVLYYIEIKKDKHGRPRICEERVEVASLESDELAALLETGRVQIAPDRLELHLALKHGQGEVMEAEGLRETRLSDRKLAGLHVYGNLLQYEVIAYLYQYISSWYFSKIGEQADLERLAQERQRNRLQLDSGNGEHHRLNEEASNIENVMAYYKKTDPELHREIIRELKKRLPDAEQIFERIKTGLASAGEHKLFALFLLLLEPEPRPLIFIENPDHGLYYSMVEDLAVLMRAYSFHEDRMQIIFTTHSQNLVENLSPDELWIIYRDHHLGQGGHLVNADDLPLVRDMYDEGIGLSALWYAGHLEPQQSIDRNLED